MSSRKRLLADALVRGCLGAAGFIGAADQRQLERALAADLLEGVEQIVNSLFRPQIADKQQSRRIAERTILARPHLALVEAR